MEDYKDVVLKTIRKNTLEVVTRFGEPLTYEVAIDSIWYNVLPFLRPTDLLGIRSKDSVLTNKDLLILDPHYLIPVTAVIDAISCPRINYVKYMGTESILEPSMVRRIVEGNMLHDVFSQRLALQNPIPDAIDNTIKRSELELLTKDYLAKDARTYLKRTASMMNMIMLKGKSEQDCENWVYGLHGKFDGLIPNSNLILELKSSKIPDTTPWPSHNIQMNMYLKMIESKEKHSGQVFYINEGQMAMKPPVLYDERFFVAARNFTYLVYTNRYVPPVLRGTKAKACNRCFVREECAELCAGLNTQRDCDICPQDSFCSKQSWMSSHQQYFLTLTDALTDEQNLRTREQYYLSRAGSLDDQQIDAMYTRGLLIKTGKKISETHSSGKIVTTFTQESSMPRFRKGEFARAYTRSSPHNYVTIYDGIIVLKLIKDTITVESANPLEAGVYITPSVIAVSEVRGRGAIYRIIKSQEPLHTFLPLSFTMPEQCVLPEFSKITDFHVAPLTTYNESQKEAILGALSTPDLYLIQGPAGTGKTSIIIELISQIRRSGKSVLASAYTNMAVDNIALKLAEVGETFIRIGNPYSTDERLHDYIPTNQPDLYRQVLENAESRIVLATTTTIGKSDYRNVNFDYVILDEAAQMREPDSLHALLLGTKGILVGDHKQLPAIVSSPAAKEKGLEISLFERLCDILANSSRFTLLRYQYRMNAQILEFPNHKYYEGKLQSATDSIALQLLPAQNYHFLQQNAYEVISLQNASIPLHTQVNYVEAMFVVGVIYDLLKHNQELRPVNIGIITPFRAQVAFLRSLLPDFSIDTVDRFQGSEREVIIFSAITMADVPILTDSRRLNVAITRAKKKLVILLSNPSTEHTTNDLDQIYANAVKRGVVTQFSPSHENLQSIITRDLGIPLDAVNDVLQQRGLFPIDANLLATVGIKHIPDNFLSIYYNTIPLSLEIYDNVCCCVICRTPVAKGVMCLGCQTYYHYDHLLEWLNTNPICPYCRHPLVLN